MRLFEVPTIVSVLPNIDGGQQAPNLKKQAGEPTWKLSSVMLWTGTATKCI